MSVSRRLHVSGGDGSAEPSLDHPNSPVNNQSINQSMNQSINQSMNQSMNQSNRYQAMSDSPKPSISAPVQPYNHNDSVSEQSVMDSPHGTHYGSASQSMNQVINQSMNQVINQSRRPSLGFSSRTPQSPANMQANNRPAVNQSHSPNFSQSQPISQPMNQSNNASMISSPMVPRRGSVQSTSTTRIIGLRSANGDPINQNNIVTLRPTSVDRSNGHSNNQNGYDIQPNGQHVSSNSYNQPINPSVNDAINQSMGIDGTARQLYTPRASPGMRAAIASPAPTHHHQPTPQSIPQTISQNYSELPALDATHRYVLTGTLQQSLFGIVKLAFDRLTSQLVAIKISRQCRAGTQTTRSGVMVLEDVRRESKVMDYITWCRADNKYFTDGHFRLIDQVKAQLTERPNTPLVNPLTGMRSLYADMWSDCDVSDLLHEHSINQTMIPSNNLLTHQLDHRRRATPSSRASNRSINEGGVMMDDDDQSTLSINQSIDQSIDQLNNQSIMSTARNSPHDSPDRTLNSFTQSNQSRRSSNKQFNPLPRSPSGSGISLLNSHVPLEPLELLTMYQPLNHALDQVGRRGTPPNRPMRNASDSPTIPESNGHLNDQTNNQTNDQSFNHPDFHLHEPSFVVQPGLMSHYYSPSMGAVRIPNHVNPSLQLSLHSPYPNQTCGEMRCDSSYEPAGTSPGNGSGHQFDGHPMSSIRRMYTGSYRESNDPLQRAIDADIRGQNHICGYHNSFQDSYYHYLITDFIPAGDLYSMLTSFPSHRLTEETAGPLFKQMVLGVQYLHVRGVAHLDMSLENMCLDPFDNVTVIDFGVSAVHPSCHVEGCNKQPWQDDTSQQHNYSINDTQKPLTPFPHRSFLCRPIGDMSAKPGKIRYMSPELFQGQSWDAFANDVFSLGVILYSLLTGRPPFQQAATTDLWFRVIYTGAWLTPQIRRQESAHVFTHLSEDALDLINCIIKPQGVRPTCEQILQHRFMTSTS